MRPQDTQGMPKSDDRTESNFWGEGRGERGGGEGGGLEKSSAPGERNLAIARVASFASFRDKRGQ